MKNLLAISLVLILSACSSPDFTKVKVGMSEKEVISLVGEPKQKQNMFFAEWWMYNNNNVVIVMSGNTVININLDAKATMDSMQKGLNELDNAMQNIEDGVPSEEELALRKQITEDSLAAIKADSIMQAAGTYQ